VFRRRIGSLLLVAAVAAMLAGNVRGAAVDQVLRFATLDQAWDVFAPNPVSTQAELQAVIELRNGRQEVWRPPRADPLLAVSTYHWDMWSRVAMEGYPPVAYATARWIAKRYADRGTPPVRVTLRRRWFAVPPPGSAGAELWRAADLYVWEPGA
jgi:hypothetical protein